MSWTVLTATDGSGESLLREDHDTITVLSFEEVGVIAVEDAPIGELEEGAWRLRVWNAPPGFEGSIELLPPVTVRAIRTRVALEWVGSEHAPWIRTTLASTLRRLRSIQIGSREHAPEEGLARLAARAEERLGEEVAELWPELLASPHEPQVEAPEDYTEFVRMFPPRPTQLTVRPREAVSAGCHEPRQLRTRTSAPRGERLLARARATRRALPKQAKSLVTLVAILVLAAQAGAHLAAGAGGSRAVAHVVAGTRLISIQEWRKLVRKSSGGNWILVERRSLRGWLAAASARLHLQGNNRSRARIIETAALRSTARMIVVSVQAAAPSPSPTVEGKRMVRPLAHPQPSAQDAADAAESLTSEGGVSDPEASAGSAQGSDAQEGAPPSNTRSDGFAGDSGGVSAGG